MKEGTQTVKVEWIDLDHSTQARATMRPEVVEEYRDQLEKESWPFPPVVLFEVAPGRKRYLIGDGFHRVAAALTAKLKQVPAEVRPGGRDAAMEWAIGANATHGLRRTREDVRRAIELADEMWPTWTDTAIAGKVGVDHKTVTKWRPKRVEEVPKVRADGAKVQNPLGAAAHKARQEPTPAPDPEDEWVWVETEERPTLGEVHPWVTEIPTWGELAAGSGADSRERDGVAWVRRDLVVDWCRMLDSDGNPNWGGFRKEPVSIEHAMRERERLRAETVAGRSVQWCKKLREILLLEMGTNAEVFAAAGTDVAKLVWRHVPIEARKIYARMTGETLEDAEERLLNQEDGDWTDSVLLLSGTDLHATGPEGAEKRAIKNILHALKHEKDRN